MRQGKGIGANNRQRVPEATVEMERLATTLDHAKKPKATVIAALVNPANPIDAETSERDLRRETCKKCRTRKGTRIASGSNRKLLGTLNPRIVETVRAVHR